jgi:YidC/Oxa1 family membrane protein insertase
MKSMSRMKDLQPKINALRQKHKSNSAKMNQEIMALYKKEGVNPLNPGCLPMLLQMPVFIALFIVLRKAIELRGASTILVPWIHDLSLPESLFSFEKILPSGIPLYGSNFALLPIIMAVLTYFQNKMTIKDPNQKMMIYFMPIFMLVLFNNFSSGLVLYWTSSSALGLIQQYYTEKRRKKTSVQDRPAPVSSAKKAQ